MHLSLTKSIGGIASFQKNLFNNTDRSAVAFEFVTTYPDSALIPFFEENDVKIHRLPPQKTILSYCLALYRLLKKEKYVEEFYPKAEEMYDFIQNIINITGNVTENGETIPTMLKFFNMWNEYDSETFWILSELVHKK